MILQWIPITLSVYNHSVDDFPEVFKIIRSQLESLIPLQEEDLNGFFNKRDRMERKATHYYPKNVLLIILKQQLVKFIK